MSSDFDHFKDTFITESNELLEEMEERLIGLDDEHLDLEEVNAIFRCAHSIKGGAGAFGFTQLVAFTHILEALLDEMREGRMMATHEVIDALLASVDVVLQLVQAAQEGTTLPEGFGSELANKLKSMVGLEINDSSAAKEEDIAAPLKTKVLESFKVKFSPKPDLFSSGNEPLLILRELSRCGVLSINVNSANLPDFDDLDPEKSYLKWEIDVETKEGQHAIEEAFEFVEEDCDLTIEKASSAGDFEEGDDIGLFDDALEEIGSARAAESFEEGDDIGLFDDALDEIDSARKETKLANDVPVKVVVADKPDEVKAKPVTAVSTIRVDIDKVDNLVNMVGELVITQSMIVNQTRILPTEQYHALIQGVGDLERHTRDLQEAVMAVRMQPVKSVFARMPRIVRDLSRKLGKEIKIETKGEMTEIDKTVIEQLGDPLTHMIRNSIDHGIEMPDVREKNGKSRHGTVMLSADNTGGRIVIEISDDGAGINRERVLSIAIEKGVVSKEAKLEDEEIDNLIFAAGFSTAETVTDVSGRGVGMDVVRRNIAELGGTIILHNDPGNGSRFQVTLPLTLAILDGMIIRVGSEDYIIPINNILESLKPHDEDIKKISGGPSVINVRGEFVPLLYLNRLFGISDTISDDENEKDDLIVLVESGREKFGLVVNELIGQQQVVIKSIEENSEPVEGISGATILGDGKVALILDIAGLQLISVNETQTAQAA